MKRRYNIFRQIHKGLRAMLYDTAITLQLTDFQNSDEAGLALDKLSQTLHTFYQHADHEDKFILPMLKKTSPALVEEFDSEHGKDEFMTHRINNLVTLYHHVGSAEGMEELGEKICIAFNEFVAFNLYHMAKEEEKINPVLWMQYTDEEICCIRKSLSASISNEEAALVNKWMMQGINDAEILHWLRDVKNNAPEFIFQSMIALAEKVLSPARWNRLQNSLSEGLLLA